MSSQRQTAARLRSNSRLRLHVVSAAALALLVAMALDTKVVKIGSAVQIAITKSAFSPAAFGAAEFPRVKAAVEERAVDAAALAAAVAKDKDAAAKQYGLEPSKSGVAASTGTVICVKFTGVVGKGDSGEYAVEVAGVPSDLAIRVQTGPAEPFAKPADA